MASKGNMPIFAVGSIDKIKPAINAGVLTYPSYVFATDTDQLVFVDKNLDMRIIKGDNTEIITAMSEMQEKISDLTSQLWESKTIFGELPEEGNPNQLYVQDSKVYLWDDEKKEFKPLIADSELKIGFIDLDEEEDEE